MPTRAPKEKRVCAAVTTAKYEEIVGYAQSLGISTSAFIIMTANEYMDTPNRQILIRERTA